MLLIGIVSALCKCLLVRLLPVGISLSGAPILSAFSLPDGVWECAVCTYRNEGPRTLCEMCATSRSGIPEAVPKASELSYVVVFLAR